MQNPFKHVGNVMGDLWQAADHSDCTAPGLNKTGVVLAAPIIVPAVFIHALFTNKKEQACEQ